MKILFAYPTFPEPDTNAGGLRLFEILRILVGRGHRVTLLAQKANDHRYREALQALGVECATDADESLADSVAEFHRFFQQRSFDVAIMVHYHIYNTYAPYLRAFLPKCRLVLDTVDLHFVRLQREAALTSDPIVHQHAETIRREETSALFDADTVWVVTETERQVLLRDVISNGVRVHVVPTIHPLAKNFPGYDQRQGIVFLGGYRHSPNVDGVRYFIEEVLPILRTMLPGVHITLAGSHPPGEVRKYERGDSRVAVTGFVADHRALLASHLVGIAPLRYGAGMKGKIGEYLACGLPCVSTSIGVEGMDMRHEHEVLIADDSTRFARAIVRLHHDQALWHTLSHKGVEYIQNRLSPEAIAPLVLDAAHSSRETYVHKSRGVVARLLKGINHPRKLLQLFLSAIRALRKGGTAELHSRVKLWASRQ